MKIIHITFSLPNAGKENMLVDIANEQSLHGNKVAIIVINNNTESSIKERISSGIQLYELKRKRSSRSLIPIFSLFLLLNFRFRADVIHIHDPKIEKMIRWYCRIPLVLTIHNTHMDTRPMIHFKRLFAISETVKNDIEKRSNLRCSVIYNGIKTEEIIRKEVFSSPDIFRMILVKRLDYSTKGQDILIKAHDLLNNRKGIENILLHLVGDGISREYLEKLIRDMKLQDHIILMGNRSREWVYNNLHTYDLFVHPSRFEGFGLSIAEAMAAKVPVIASNIEGPAEILEYGRHGMLFKTDDASELALQIENAMRLYRSGEISNYIESAYNHCIRNFDISRTAREYCESY